MPRPRIIICSSLMVLLISSSLAFALTSLKQHSLRSSINRKIKLKLSCCYTTNGLVHSQTTDQLKQVNEADVLVAKFSSTAKPLDADITYRQVPFWPKKPLDGTGIPADEAYNYVFPVGKYRSDRVFNPNGYSNMEVTFIGTSSSISTDSRGVSCLAVRRDDEIWIFDCGEGSQARIQQSRLKLSKVTKVFITHTHGDHIFGLPGLLCGLGQAKASERDAQQGGGNEIIDVYGPPGIRDFIRVSLQVSSAKSAVSYRVHELKDIPFLHFKYSRYINPYTTHSTPHSSFGEVSGGKNILPNKGNGTYTLFSEKGITVSAAPLQHTVPCVGYVLHEENKPGALRIDLVKDVVEKHRVYLKESLGLVDGRQVYQILKNLKPEEEFLFPDGTVVKGEEVIKGQKLGRKIVILGDNCNASMITDLAMDADLLVHEATNAWIDQMDGLRCSQEQLERETIKHGHSTPGMAGKFANRIRAKQLLLTHFSARYCGDESDASMDVMWRIENLARETSGLYEKNSVIAAWDSLSLPVKEKKDYTDD